MKYLNLNQLCEIATNYDFRQPSHNESEITYRFELSKYLKPINTKLSIEIEYDHPWEQFSTSEQFNILTKGLQS